MEPRLSSRTLVTALLRLAERDGGFGAVLAKGDDSAGAVTVILAERGERRLMLERLLERDGRYAWREAGNPALTNEEEFQKLLQRRRKFDPDLWVVELDIASAERFAAEMRGLD